ncbi:MAG: hypothetical protein JXR58_02440 [Bacteroidales bacterium]|nr:hypothetical protein [Bacteroidales bacterium]
MKKIRNIFILGLVAFALVSCTKKDATKDVDLSIAKLEQFNKTFDELYEDGVIATDTVEGKKQSEYDELKKLASEYYESINQINTAIKEEKEDGKDEYSAAYKKALEEKNEKILELTAKFEENLAKISKPAL